MVLFYLFIIKEINNPGCRILKIITDSESLISKTRYVNKKKAVEVKKNNVKNWGKYGGWWVLEKVGRGDWTLKILTDL